MIRTPVEYYDFECPVCGKTYTYTESCSGWLYKGNDVVAMMTKDCHGIPFRKVCFDCYEKIMDEKGYDGEYYTELDECIDYDY